jgi:hypothetical protein
MAYPANGRLKFACETIAQQGWQKPVRLAHRDPQVTIDRPEEIKPLVLAIGQNGGWRIGFQYQPLRESLQAAALRFCLYIGVRPKRAGELADIRRKGPTRPFAGPKAALDLHRIRYLLETIGQLTDGFRSTQEQHTILPQGKVEQGQDLILFLGPQVDQQIATRYEIEARERRVGQQILNRKDD